MEDQIILGVRVRPETMRVDQENDMSSRWSCEKFAEASLMRLQKLLPSQLLKIFTLSKNKKKSMKSNFFRLSYITRTSIGIA